MENFREAIKAPTKEEKIKAMDDMFCRVVMCSFLLSQADQEECIKRSKRILSEEEAIVTYELLRRLRMLIELPSKSIVLKKKLFEFLDINNNAINNKENLYKFIVVGVKDYEENNRKQPAKDWNLQIEKIMKRVEEQDKKKQNEESIKEMEN